MALYLEDLSVGQIFKSRAYPVTVEEIKNFAQQYDPQPFHLDEIAAENTFLKAWPLVVGIRRPLPCDCWWKRLISAVV